MSEHYRFTYHPYQRSFSQPLKTSHGEWSKREGILICLHTPTDQQLWGEIAPIPWFGSETVTAALDFCRSLAGHWTSATEIPDCLPACQFAWSAALHYGQVSFKSLTTNHDPYWSVLLPAGEQALHSWQTPWQLGTRTFKWKIGVGAIEHELQLLHHLTNNLPSTVQLRLDANGGLNLSQAKLWLEQCETLANIEFLEQPLEELREMQQLAEQYRTPLALDESVSNLSRLQDCYEQGWRGIFVIKPAIAGSLCRLADYIHHHQLDIVCSTSLESPVGQNAICQWAQEQGFDRRALGFGVQHWFSTPQLSPANFIYPTAFPLPTLLNR